MRDAFFFGPGGGLYGVYEEPARTPRQTGVVLCYPFGQEYIRAHRTFVLLAERLADVGFPVLRFDFSGTGDSTGDTELHSLDQWRLDLANAIEALQGITGTERVCVVGGRLGATIAATAPAGAARVLVLWDPVTDGVGYLEELHAADEHYCRQLALGAPRTGHSAALGFRICRRLRRDLEALSAERLVEGLDVTTAVVVADFEQEGPARLRHISSGGTSRISFVEATGMKWLKTAEDHGIFVPNQLVSTLVERIGATCA